MNWLELVFAYAMSNNQEMSFVFSLATPPYTIDPPRRHATDCAFPRFIDKSCDHPFRAGPSCATTSISTLMSSSPSLCTPTQVHMGAWSGIHSLKPLVMAARASLFNGTWYELTRKTCFQPPSTPASFKQMFTFSNACAICALISVLYSPVWGCQPPEKILEHCTSRRVVTAYLDHCTRHDRLREQPGCSHIA